MSRRARMGITLGALALSCLHAPGAWRGVRDALSTPAMPSPGTWAAATPADAGTEAWLASTHNSHWAEPLAEPVAPFE